MQREAAPFLDRRETSYHFRKNLRADDIVDDEIRKGFRDEGRPSKRIRIQYPP
jgi:hypothetical protein